MGGSGRRYRPADMADMAEQAASTKWPGRRAMEATRQEPEAQVAEAEPRVRGPSRTRRRTSDRPRPAVCRRWRRTRIPSSSLGSPSRSTCRGIAEVSRRCGGSLRGRPDLVLPDYRHPSSPGIVLERRHCDIRAVIRCGMGQTCDWSPGEPAVSAADRAYRRSVPADHRRTTVLSTRARNRATNSVLRGPLLTLSSTSGRGFAA